MTVPTGYDVGLQHASVNGGVAVGLMLDDSNHEEPLIEDQALVATVDTSTAGVTSVASYGPGPCTYRARVLLRSDVLKRNHQTTTEVPTATRALLLAFAALTDGATKLQLPTGDRYVAFTEAVKFISGPNIDGYIAVLTMTDLGAA